MVCDFVVEAKFELTLVATDEVLYGNEIYQETDELVVNTEGDKLFFRGRTVRSHDEAEKVVQGMAQAIMSIIKSKYASVFGPHGFTVARAIPIEIGDWELTLMQSPTLPEEDYITVV
jgi:hypothetical protein